MEEIKVGVIIKHPFRDGDWRIDIVKVPENLSNDEIKTQIEREMLGPFQVVAISRQINYERKFKS